jgi:hypothetical protein
MSSPDVARVHAEHNSFSLYVLILEPQLLIDRTASALQGFIGF